jgi:hypothetical protein
MGAKIIEVTKYYDAELVWEALTGSDFMGLNHWVKEMSCDPENIWATFPVTHLDADSREVTTQVTREMIEKGFALTVNLNDTHCGGHPLDNLEDSDACFADVVLQRAIFGEVMYG